MTKHRNWLWLLTIWTLLLIAGSCARRGTPTGGPKDSIPPKLVRMYPELEIVNFSDKEIELEFDEYIESRDLKRELIITPPIEDYSFYVSRRTLHLEIEEELRDSTTYTFNFREAVKDISEKNPAEDLIVAFSTGPEIDSFLISGTVRNLMTQQPSEEVVVALYDVNDTLDAFTGPPMYLAKTDEEGNYVIRYIREGLYNIYAYVDDNTNLKIDSNNEPFGFKTDPVYLGSNVNREIEADSTFVTDSIPSLNRAIDLVIQQQDVRPIQLQSARSNGKYFEVKFNKSLKDYSLTVADEKEISASTQSFLQDSVAFNVVDSTIYLFSNFQDQQKVVRVYNTLKQDSLAAKLSVADSAQQTLSDTTLYLKFADSRRDFADFTSEFASNGTEITDTISSKLTFSKPIARVNTDSILLSYDTLFYIPLNYSQSLKWNKSLDEVEVKIPIDKNDMVDSVIYYMRLNDSSIYEYRIRQQTLYLDSLTFEVEVDKKMNWLGAFIQAKDISEDRALLDSLNATEDEDLKVVLLDSYVDTVTINREFPVRNYDREEIINSLGSFNFYASAGSFMSIENDSSEQIIQKYSFKNPEDYGTISGTITTDYTNFFIQLLNQQFEVVRESKNSKKFNFELVPPGKYQIRVLIDEDGDGQWEAGSILSQEEPEPVYFYTEEELIDLRANWERTDLNIIIGELSTLSSE